MMEYIIEFDDLIETQARDIPGMVGFYINYAQAVLQQAHVKGIEQINDLARISHLLAQEGQRGNREAQSLFEDIQTL